MLYCVVLICGVNKLPTTIVATTSTILCFVFAQSHKTQFSPTGHSLVQQNCIRMQLTKKQVLCTYLEHPIGRWPILKWRDPLRVSKTDGSFTMEIDPPVLLCSTRSLHLLLLRWEECVYGEIGVEVHTY